MKLHLNQKKKMDIGTPEFLWMRTTMAIKTGGADLSECQQIIEKIRDPDKSWIAEWSKKADELAESAHKSFASNRVIKGRNQLLRASTYYRTAMMRSEASSPQADNLLTQSRESYILAMSYIAPAVQFVKIPFGEHLLPAYYYHSGKKGSPTLIGINGGDSTNEEMFNLLGFAAMERGWNCLVYEGPGQYTARQLNPGLHLMADWEAPNGAIVDWLMERPEIAKDKIALFGWSLSSNLAIRAAALDKRIAAVIANGLIVDVYQAWYGVWPKWLQKAKPKYFDFFFHLLEKLSPQVRVLTSTFYKMHGVNTPTKMIQAWKPFNVGPFAGRLDCPALFITGEAEYAEQSNGPLILSVGKFLKDLKSPAWFHEFSYADGWAASHCQIGAQQALEELVYDWLDKLLNKAQGAVNEQNTLHNFDKIISYFGKIPEVKTVLSGARIMAY